MIYIIVFMMSIFLLSRANKNCYKGIKAKIEIAFSLLIPSILAGLRDYTVGADVLIYGNIWFKRAINANTMNTYLVDANRNSMGIGYGFLNYIVSKVTDNPHWFYFVLMLFDLVLLYEALKPFSNKINIPFAFFCFYFYYFNESLNALKQIPAMLIILFSFRYVQKKRIVPFLICVFVAMTFHITALIGLLLYPISFFMNSKFKRFYTMLIYIGMIFVVVYFSTIVSWFMSMGIINRNRFSFYFSSGGVTGGRLIRICMYLFLYLLFYFKKDKIYKEVSYGRAFFMYCSFSVILSALLLLYANSYIIRVAYYFDIFLIMYVPLLVNTIQLKVGKQKKITQYVTVGTFFVIYWIIVYVIRNGGGTIPYKLMTF